MTMAEITSVHRPVSLAELSFAFGTPVSRLERLAERHKIRPLFRLGRVRAYGPAEIQRLYDVLEDACFAGSSR